MKQVEDEPSDFGTVQKASAAEPVSAFAVAANALSSDKTAAAINEETKKVAGTRCVVSKFMSYRCWVL